MDIIETQNLTKTYGNLTAVDHLDLKVGKGEVFGLLGPNGAGKSTTLMMLTTLIPPTSGTALVNGYDILRQPDQVRKSIGIVFQDPSSDETLTGYENLKLHGLLYDMDTGLREERIVEGPRARRTYGQERRHGQEIFRRDAEKARAGPGPDAPPRDPVPGRADARPRPPDPGAHLGIRQETGDGEEDHHHHHHSLYGRGRPALRPARDHKIAGRSRSIGSRMC